MPQKYKDRAVKFLLFLLPIAALGLVFRGLIFEHLFFSSGDIVNQDLPYFIYLGSGKPLILQEILFGFPAYVSTVSGWFYPLNRLCFAMFGALNGYIVLDLGNMVLAYGFAYLYARKIRLGFHAALFSALVYIFSSQVMLGAVYINNTGFYFILPASLYFFELALESKLLRQIFFLVLAGLFLGVGWLSSHVQFVVYIHTFFVAYVLFRIIAGGYAKQWFTSARLLVLPLVVSLLTGLPMIAAVLSFQPETTRAAGVSLVEAVSTGYLPWDILYYLLPFWDISFLPTHGNLYIGVIPFVLLLFVAFSYRTALFANAYVPFFVATFLFCLVAAIDYSPLAFALHYLPFYSAFRNPNEIMFIGEFAAATLAGLALEFMVRNWEQLDLYRHPATRLFRGAMLYVLLPFVALVSLVKFFFFNRILGLLDSYFLQHIYPHTTQLPKEHYLTLISTYLQQALGQFTITDPELLLLLVLSALCIMLFRFQRHVSATRFGAIVVLLTALNFAAVYASYYPMLPAGSVTSPPQSALAILALQKGDPSPYRVITVLSGAVIFNEEVRCSLTPEESFALSKEFILPNSNMLYGIDVAGGYDNYMPSLVSNALDYAGSENTISTGSLALEKIPLQQKVERIIAQRHVLEAMNVRYVVSSLPIIDPDFTPVYSEKVGRCQTPISVYELKQAWPRYFVTNRVAVTAQDPDSAAATLGELASTTRPTVILDSSSTPPVAVAPVFSTEVLPVYGTHTITFNGVSCSGDCVLFVGNTYLPGWSVLIDGKSGEILRANYLFMAVPLAKGIHSVVLQYAEPLHYW